MPLALDGEAGVRWLVRNRGVGCNVTGPGYHRVADPRDDGDTSAILPGAPRKIRAPVHIG